MTGSFRANWDRILNGHSLARVARRHKSRGSRPYALARAVPARVYRGEHARAVVMRRIFFDGRRAAEGLPVQRHIFITLPCQYCGKPERRVPWREGNAVTCFACKTARRNERANAARRESRRADQVLPQ
jgi:hypothetical protein